MATCVELTLRDTGNRREPRAPLSRAVITTTDVCGTSIRDSQREVRAGGG